MTEKVNKANAKTRADYCHVAGGQPPFRIILAVIVFFALGAAMLVLLILNVPAPEGLTAEQLAEFMGLHKRHVSCTSWG